MLKSIIVQGAREHNLKDITVEIPRDKLVVITGLSGSGKSSLAFDTIYAEGQRRYVESLSAYARQFLELMQKPDVDSIEGLSPAISIEQKTTSKNPRSTVATVTEIYDYMRLLWARVGVPYSPATGKPIESQTVTQMVDRVLAMEEGTRLYILAPIVRGRKGEYRKEFQELLAKGFQRVKVDGELYELEEVPALDKKYKHDIEVVVDRLVLRPENKEELQKRLADSLETALELADGLAIAENADDGAHTLFSEKFACPVSGFTIPEIEPRLFSFNSPHGACPSCDGLGVRLYVDEKLVVPDATKSIAQGAIAVWDGAFKGFYLQGMKSVAETYGFSVDTPWKDLRREDQEVILYGSGDTVIKTTYKSKNESSWKSNKPFEGVIPNIERRLMETDSNSQREKLSKYQSSAPCEACGGQRLNEQALAVKIAGKDIAEIASLSIEEAADWFAKLNPPSPTSADAPAPSPHGRGRDPREAWEGEGTISCRQLGEDEWEAYRDMRLKALETDEQYFGDSHKEAKSSSVQEWKEKFKNKIIFLVLDEDKPIGLTGIYIDEDDPTGKTAAFIHSFLLPEYRGKGLSQLLYAKRFEWVHTQGHLEKIIIGHRADNEASRRAILAHGFKYTHTKDDDAFGDGTCDSCCYYALNLKDQVQTPILTPQQQQIAEKILKEINDRLHFLMNVGLDYLGLSRSSGTLSGGESQRIRLASQIGSGLTGVLYVLDEPSIGLHQRDNNRLLETLKRLRRLGNTVIVVEHDEDAIREADYLIDMGPGAGVHGGAVVAAGTPDKVMKAKDSITAQYLTGTREITVPAERRKGKKGQTLTLTGATGNNLKDISASIPLGTFTCVTGVSGSGKSTFTLDTLYKALSQKIMKSREEPLPYKDLTGTEFIDKVIDIDQSPIGRTPRSNPATYTGAFTPIREWFAGLPEAKARGYGPGRFSFNVKGGRCESCKGDGVIKIEMHFLPDVYVECESCSGKRYNRETLDVKYKDRSISDVLNMTVEEGAEFFKAVPSIRDKLETLKSVGLGYIKVGQQATTLSGGEAQRVKLAKELAKRSTGKTLYILDEPTTGLHFEDVRKLLEVLHRLVDQGNTVLVIEHNLDVIKTADYLIDIGPEGGHKGGQVIATGTPEDICEEPKSYTGQFLAPMLKKSKAT